MGQMAMITPMETMGQMVVMVPMGTTGQMVVITPMEVMGQMVMMVPMENNGSGGNDGSNGENGGNHEDNGENETQKPTIPPIIGEDWIELGWYAIPGAAYYEIHQDGKLIHTQQENGSELYQYKVENLTPEAKYHFEIIPFASDGTELDDDTIDVGDIDVHPSINVNVYVEENEAIVKWDRLEEAIDHEVVVQDQTGNTVDKKTTKRQEISFEIPKAGTYTAVVYPIVEGNVKKPGVAKAFSIATDKNNPPTAKVLPNKKTKRWRKNKRKRSILVVTLRIQMEIN